MLIIITASESGLCWGNESKVFARQEEVVLSTLIQSLTERSHFISMPEVTGCGCFSASCNSFLIHFFLLPSARRLSMTPCDSSFDLYIKRQRAFSASWKNHTVFFCSLSRGREREGRKETKETTSRGKREGSFMVSIYTWERSLRMEKNSWEQFCSTSPSGPFKGDKKKNL